MLESGKLSPEVLRQIEEIVSTEGDSYLTEWVDARLRASVESYKAQMKSYVQGVVQDYQNRYAKLQTFLDRSMIVPDITYLTSHKIRFGSRDGVLMFILPFHYAPVSIDGKRIAYPQQLQREIVLVVYVRGGPNPLIERWCLSNDDERLSKFHHYHCYVKDDHWFRDDHRYWYDCVGSFSFSEKIKGVEDLVRFRDALQTLFSDIHKEYREGELLNPTPDGLPNLHHIVTTKEVIRWDADMIKKEAQKVVASTSVAKVTVGTGEENEWVIVSQNSIPAAPVYILPGLEDRRTRRREYLIGTKLSLVFLIVMSLITLYMPLSLIVTSTTTRNVMVQSIDTTDANNAVLVTDSGEIIEGADMKALSSNPQAYVGAEVQVKVDKRFLYGGTDVVVMPIVKQELQVTPTPIPVNPMTEDMLNVTGDMK